MGYLLKDRVADVDGFVAAVRQVAGGGTVLDPEVVAALVSGASPNRPLDRLTPREREVLTLMAEGRSNAAVAARLFLVREGRRQAHHQHLHQARPAARHRRQPPGARGAGVAAGLTTTKAPGGSPGALV